MIAERTATIDSICRLVLTFRQLGLLLLLAYMAYEREYLPALAAAFVIAAVASYLPVRYWRRIGAPLVANPALLAVDLAISFAVLALAGPETPIFFYTLGTAVLAGVLHGWAGAACFAAALVGGYFGIAELAGDDLSGFTEVVAMPALYPLAALAGAELRGLASRQVEAEQELAVAGRAAAASEERARLAREMHDSLAKTLHGLAFTAAGLGRQVERDPDRVRTELRTLAATAANAAEDARSLIGDLRASRLEVPLGRAIREYVEGWSATSEIAASVRTDGSDLPSPRARHELFFILKESLANVERHAEASSVAVAMQGEGEEVVLSIVDDGVGMSDPDDRQRLRAERHYGLLGMSERAARLGGRLEVSSAPGQGTTISVVVPAIPGPDGGEESLEGAREMAARRNGS